MVDYNDILQRLAASFKTYDIMTPKDTLVCAENLEAARSQLETDDKYDVIPISQEGRITSFLHRESQKQKVIHIQHVISGHTPILELIDTLCTEQFAFVVDNREVIGFVHFSDLNDPMVKIPYFVLLEAVERKLAAHLRDKVNLEDIQKAITDSQRVQFLIDKMNGLKKEKAERDWVTLLFFPEILSVAKQFGHLPDLKPKERQDLESIRSTIAHAASKRELVEEHKDVKKLRDGRELCHRILKFQRAP